MAGIVESEKSLNSDQIINRPFHNDDLHTLIATLKAELNRLQCLANRLESDYEQLVLEGKKLNESRLNYMDDQLQANLHQQRFLTRVKKFLKPKLGVLHQHTPIPLRIPPTYYQSLPLHTAPRISIVTPSFNQSHFLEKTIESVKEQAYSNVEYIIQDGGSEDETAAVIDKYRDFIAYAESKKDNGQSHAINLGFKHATGEIMAYLNSDDLLLPGTLNYIAHYFNSHPEVDVVYGHRVLINKDDKEIGRWVLPPHDENVLTWADFIPQETLFWRRRIWEKAGSKIDEQFRFAMDWDLLLRFQKAGAVFARLPRFLGAFRVHHAQKTSAVMSQVGDKEMYLLRERCHGRSVSRKEISKGIRPYLLRHLIYQKLYRLGLLSY